MKKRYQILFLSLLFFSHNTKLQSASKIRNLALKTMSFIKKAGIVGGVGTTIFYLHNNSVQYDFYDKLQKETPFQPQEPIDFLQQHFDTSDLKILTIEDIKDFQHFCENIVY